VIKVNFSFVWIKRANYTLYVFIALVNRPHKAIFYVT